MIDKFCKMADWHENVLGPRQWATYNSDQQPHDQSHDQMNMFDGLEIDTLPPLFDGPVPLQRMPASINVGAALQGRWGPDADSEAPTPTMPWWRALWGDCGCRCFRTRAQWARWMNRVQVILGIE